MVVLVVGGEIRERNRKQDKNESREPEDFVEESGGMMMRKIAITSARMSRVEKAAEYISLFLVDAHSRHKHIFIYVLTNQTTFLHTRT